MFSDKVANFKDSSRPNKEIKYFSRTLTEIKDFSRQLLKFKTFSRDCTNHVCNAPINVKPQGGEAGCRPGI